MAQAHEINLDEVRTPPTSGLLSGRDSGIAARQHFHVDSFDKDAKPVHVIIPDAVFSMNTSFFLGLFGDSVRTFGAAGFRSKYIFGCDEAIHRPTIERGIEKALKERTVFPEKKTA